MERLARARRLHRHGRRVRAASWPAGRACSSRAQEEMLRTRATCWRACSRRCRGCSSACRGWRWASGRFRADREASTASNYTAGTADGIAAGVVQHEHLPAAGAGEVHGSKRWCCTKPCPGTTCRSGWRASSRACPSSGRCSRPRRSREGWGSTPSRWARSSGVYRDPPTRFGQLASEQFRAVRLVVDTGIHAMGWSRDRAREYFSLHVPGQSLAEVDRYIARPGQALAYKLGELKIKELRRQGRAGARRAVRRPRVPRRRAAERHAAARPAGGAGRRIYRQVRDNECRG